MLQFNNGLTCNFLNNFIKFSTYDSTKSVNFVNIQQFTKFLSNFMCPTGLFGLVTFNYSALNTSILIRYISVCLILGGRPGRPSERMAAAAKGNHLHPPDQI